VKSFLLNLWAWVLSDPLYALATVGVGFVLAWKALPARLREAAELRSPRIVGAIRTLVALLPDLIGAARIVRYQAVGGQPRSIVSDRAAAQADKLREATKPEPKDPPPASPGYSEQLLLLVLGGITLVVFLGAVLTGCPMPAPDGCSPGSRRCHEDTPQVCSPGQRWTPADVTCSTVNAVCEIRRGIPACVRGAQ